MFIVVDKRRLWIIFISVILLCTICAAAVALYCYVPHNSYTVVIDAGHGGQDGGVVGVESGVTEAEINLLVAYTLKSKFEERGVKVIMTREDKSVLGTEKGGKKEDFNKRREIILSAKPDAVISVHQNKFPDSSRRGAQVFYNSMNVRGKALAEAVQQNLNVLNEKEVGRSFSSLKGDYYILNCSDYPSCIIECGFLSNREDEKLLTSTEYRDKLAEAIVGGVFAYFNERSL